MIRSLGLLLTAILATSAVDTEPPPFPVAERRRGPIVFAADPGGGATLTDRLDRATAELEPQPMDIYITRVGGTTRRWISTDAHERCPTFSPDGHRLAYLETPGRSRAASVVVVRLNASGNPGAPELRVPLPSPENYDVDLGFGVPCPQWSPDGRRLAYLAYTLPDFVERDDWMKVYTPYTAEVRVSTLEGQERVVSSATPAHFNGPLAWSPDGDVIAFAAADGVWSAPIDGGTPSLLWRTDGLPVAVSWSSRGELAVNVVKSNGDPRATIHVVDAETGAEQMHGAMHLYDSAAAWSPDGSQLAFVNDDGHIVLSDRHSGSTVSLSPPHDNGEEFHFWDVAWSPDGARLLALAWSISRGLALVSLSPDGASADVLTPWTWSFDWINLGDVTWQKNTTRPARPGPILRR